MSLLVLHLVLCMWAMISYFNWWYLLTAWLVAKLFNAVGNEIALHRLWCHKSFQTSRWKEYLLHVFALPMLYGSSITYAGIHRQHHAYSDTERDPHVTRPWWKVVFYVRNPKYHIEHKFISDIIKDPLHRWLHKHYFLLNTLLVIMCVIVFGVVMTGWFLSFMIIYNFIAAGLVNVFGHRPEYGTRTHDTRDQSSNNRWLQILTWNEGLHHNHHANAGSYTFRMKPGDVDVPAWIIERFFMVKAK